MPPADRTPDPKPHTTIMEAFFAGVIVAAIICIPIARNWGYSAAQTELAYEESAMDQAQRRHREAMQRREQKLEFVHQCVDELQHVPEGEGVLSFCEREANRWY